MELPKAGNAARAALPGFVSTAVLTSSDGVRCTKNKQQLCLRVCMQVASSLTQWLCVHVCAYGFMLV
jgi:hypothetical protein